jgi:hypothetical protein
VWDHGGRKVEMDHQGLGDWRSQDQLARKETHMCHVKETVGDRWGLSLKSPQQCHTRDCQLEPLRPLEDLPSPSSSSFHSSSLGASPHCSYGREMAKICSPEGLRSTDFKKKLSVLFHFILFCCVFLCRRANPGPVHTGQMFYHYTYNMKLWFKMKLSFLHQLLKWSYFWNKLFLSKNDQKSQVCDPSLQSQLLDRQNWEITIPGQPRQKSYW